MRSADPHGALFAQLTAHLVALAEQLGFQVELPELDPVCGLDTSHVLQWAEAGARHAGLAYQRHLLAGPIAFLKQDSRGALELGDLLAHDRWLDQAQDQASRRFAAACHTLSGSGLGLIWPRDETAGTPASTDAAAAWSRRCVGPDAAERHEPPQTMRS